MLRIKIKLNLFLIVVFTCFMHHQPLFFAYFPTCGVVILTPLTFYPFEVLITLPNLANLQNESLFYKNSNEFEQEKTFPVVMFVSFGTELNV